MKKFLPGAAAFVAGASICLGILCWVNRSSDAVTETTSTATEDAEPTTPITPADVAKAALLINGAPADGEIALPPGRIALTLKDAPPALRVELREERTGRVWYNGKAKKFDFSFWMIRPEEYRIEAKLGTGDSARVVKFSIKPAPGPILYTGLRFDMIRLGADDTGVPEADAFRAPAWSVGADAASIPEEYKNYPAYRTAESAAPMNADAPLMHRPGYWRGVVASPDVLASSRSFQEPTPIGVSLRGLLRVNKPGPHTFRLTTRSATRLKIGGKVCEPNSEPNAPLQFTRELQPGLVEWELTLATNEPKSRGFTLEWKTPKETEFEPLDGENFLYEVTPAEEKAYLLFTKNAPWRNLSLDHTGAPVAETTPAEGEPSPAVETPPADEPVAEHEMPEDGDIAHAGKTPVVAKTSAGESNSVALSKEKSLAELTSSLALWEKNRGTPAGDDLAHKMFGLVTAYVDNLLANKVPMKDGTFYQVDGDTLQAFVALRPVSEYHLRTPQLQEEAIRAQLAMRRYAAWYHHATPSPLLQDPKKFAMWLGGGQRSFFSEWHLGTNDCYSDRINFVANIKRSAEVWDSPIAFDMARSLYDNHFSYKAGIGEGLGSDSLLTFHNVNGRQIYTWHYGRDWLNRVVAMNAGDFGSPWGDTREQFRRVAETVLNMEWSVYHGAMSFAVSGRSNTGLERRGLREGLAARLLNPRVPAGALDADLKKRLREMIARAANKPGVAPLEGNRFFAKNLFMVHRRADYYLDVKMNSRIVAGPESFRGAIPGNLAFGDGVTTLLRKGDEYRAIHADNLPQALWRYRSLPGITQLDYEWGDPTGASGNDRYRTGGGEFAGGVSDGKTGNCSFDFKSANPSATTARKFFAFTEDGMAVLGNSIDGVVAAKKPYTYRTNINQCTFRAPVTIIGDNGREQTVAPGKSEDIAIPLTRPCWVQHDGIGYIVLPTHDEAGVNQPGTLHVRTSVRTPLNRLGDDVWKNKKTDAYRKQCEALIDAKPPRETPVLEIWIDHGPQPKSAKCAYFVCMRPEKKTPASWLSAPPVRILENSAELMAVRDVATGTVHAAFRKPGSLRDSGKEVLSAKEPACVMLVPGAGKTADLHVQDPVAGTTGDITKMSDVIRLGIPSAGGVKEIAVDMPGKGCPDDRYRGLVVHRHLGAE